MKIQIVSDIHYDLFKPMDRIPIKIVGDVLVIAGDIAHSPVLFAEFLTRLAPKVPTIVVLGNHELWFMDFFTGIDSYRKAARLASPNITILDDAASDLAVIDDVSFIGTTLWTDYAKGTHLEACKRCMWELQEHCAEQASLNATNIIERYRKNVSDISSSLSQPTTNKRVVVTHHTPSFRCVPDSYIGDPANGAFHSDLDGLILDHQPDLWICGHTHDSVDFMLGKTRVIANPFGYIGRNVNKEFNSELIVEV